MANEIDKRWGDTGLASGVLYVQIRQPVSRQVWNGTAFEAFTVANVADYDVALAESAAGSYLYRGTFPAGITTFGEYLLEYFLREGASPAVSDPFLGDEPFWWSGAARLSLSDYLSLLLGLSGENQVHRDLEYDGDGNLTEETVRLYRSKATADADDGVTGLVREFLFEAEYFGGDQLTSWKQTRVT